MKIAETTPPFCTACHGQYPDRRHVDFEAAYDGPVFEGKGVHTGDGGAVSQLPMGIDDLMICEDCLKAAAKLLGWAGPGAQRKVEQLEQALEQAQADFRAEVEEREHLLAALETRKQKPRPDTEEVAA